MKFIVYNHFANLLKYLKEIKCKLYSITENFDTNTSAGKFMANMLCNLAEFESNNTSDKVKDGMNQKKRQEGNEITKNVIFENEM